MVSKHAEIDGIVRLLHRHNKTLLNSVAKDKNPDCFDAAVDRVFGPSDTHQAIVEFDQLSVLSFGRKKHMVSFLPVAWCEELAMHSSVWSGCERWWAGLPMIALLEFRMATASKSGYIRLVAEVGPLRDLGFRQRLVGAIHQASALSKLSRIMFPQGAAQSRYSRFLHRNSIEINDVKSVVEIETALRGLITDFIPEINAVTRAIRHA